MKTSTLMFNIAAIVALLGIFIGIVDLMKHKTKSYGVATVAPMVFTTAAPRAALVATAMPETFAEYESEEQ